MLGEMLFATVVRTIRKVMDASDRASQIGQNVILAFALVQYQQRNGRYPIKLADLTPTYLPQVPTDTFTGKDLIYQANATGSCSTASA